ncbi:SMC-Scp complex subunit ScpB [Rhizobium beringeri]
MFDRELEDLPAELRWREWMLRVEAVIFASAEPVSRETLARVIGKDCSIDLLIDDLRARNSVPGPMSSYRSPAAGRHRTRSRYADAIRSSSAPTRSGAAALSEFEAMVLMAVGYYQPVTRGELSKIFGKEVSRDTIAALRSAGFLASDHAVRRPAHPIPTSRPDIFYRPSAWRHCATSRTSRRWRMRGCSAGRYCSKPRQLILRMRRRKTSEL